MSSYFDYYCNSLTHKDSEIIYGTCYSMCPLEEVRLREKEGLVHMLEVVGNERKLVKSYSRSAADSNMAVPQHLRPYSVLRGTVDYLLFEVTRRTGFSLSFVYDFVNDRLRAVRQDITIQRLSPGQCAQLLEPMVRFYVYFGYRLHGLPLKDYDPVLNKKYLLECMKWFLSCCDSLDDPHCNGKVDDLCDTLEGMQINSLDQPKYDRVLVESLYILCNLDDIHPMLRYLSLPKELKMDSRLQLAYKVAVANLKGNFIRISKLLNSLCSLSYCAVCLHLPAMQRQGLQVLSHAYSSKRLTVSGGAVCGWLSFGSEWEARAVSRHYGLALHDSHVRFEKGLFNSGAPMHSPKIQLLHDGRYANLTMEHIFTY